MLTGDNGLLTKASWSKEETRGAAVEEAINLWKTEKVANKLTGSGTAKTAEQLIDSLGPDGDKFLTAEECTKLKNGETIIIGSRKNISISSAKTLVEAFNDGEIKVGDYVNYTPVAGRNTNVKKEETGYDETQNYTVNMGTTWRVLGLSEDGTSLLLTSGSPIKKDGDNPYLVMQGAESYYGCEDALNKICAIYKNDFAQEVRSMTIDDINLVLGITVDSTTNTVYKTADADKTNIDQLGSLGNSYQYRDGNYAPENYLKATYPSNSKYQALTNKKVGDPVPGTSYYYSYTDSNVVDQGSTLYKLLFEGTIESENYAKSYWLASPGAVVDPGYVAVFGPGAVYGGDAGSGGNMFYSYGYWIANEFAVRPVVHLKSEVTVDDIQVISGSEEPWTTSPRAPVTSGSLSGTTGQVEGSTGSGTGGSGK